MIGMNSTSPLPRVITKSDLSKYIDGGLFRPPDVGGKRQVGQQEYVIAKDGSWRRTDKSVKQKRKDFRTKRKERRQNAKRSES